MQSEHLSNLHPGWVIGGWLVAVAVSSGGFLFAVGLGLVGPGQGGSGFLVATIIVVGFFMGGFFVGVRWADAPTLHGVAIALTSVFVWFAGELLTDLLAPGLGSPVRDVGFALGVVLLQLAAAVAGGRAGRRVVLRGRGGGAAEE